MVVTAHPLASEVGLEILIKGGNAIDATVAVALEVVHPRAGNLGGGGFLVFRDSTGKVTTLDFREKAPMASTRDMFLDSAGNVIPLKSEKGILAAAVPGSPAGLYEMHQQHGHLPWAELLKPSIDLAKNGFDITALEAQRLNTYKPEFIELNGSSFPFVKDEPWQAGDHFVQTQLAMTLQSIADHGRDAFYTGEHATQLAAFCAAQQGLITYADLESYQPTWREPWINHFRGYDLYSMPLPSSGGIVLGNILDRIESHLIDSLGQHHPQNVHLVVEAARRAYMMRASTLGDADHYPVNLDSLINTKDIRNQFADFDPSHATVSLSLYADTVQNTNERFETTHISIVDKQGNAASLTTTLNGNYGCKVWFPYGGYFLNNEMDDFSAKPGVPNYFGLIGGEANAIAPGKRMLSSMTPTIITKDNKLFMVLGTPGGSTIMTSVLQVFLSKTVFNKSIDDAVQMPRYHHQWLPDHIMHEASTFDSITMQQLSSMGHKFERKEALGAIEAIYVDEKGLLHGAADHRSDDHAAGY
jgi:gamma-glutamyltranspeptidase/glutathione hydrolase